MTQRHCFVWWRRGLPCPVTKKVESEEDLDDPVGVHSFPKKNEKTNLAEARVAEPVRITAPTKAILKARKIEIKEPEPVGRKTIATPTHVRNLIMDMVGSEAVQSMPFVKAQSEFIPEFANFYKKDVRSWNMSQLKNMSQRLTPQFGGSPIPSHLKNRLGAAMQFGLGSNLIEGLSKIGWRDSPTDILQISELASSRSVSELLRNLDQSTNHFLSMMKNVHGLPITMGTILQLLQNIPVNNLPLHHRIESMFEDTIFNPRGVEFFQKPNPADHIPLNTGQDPKGQQLGPLRDQYKSKPHVPWRTGPPGPAAFPKEIVGVGGKLAMEQSYKKELGKMLGRRVTNQLFTKKDDKRRIQGRYQNAEGYNWAHRYGGSDHPTGGYYGDWFSGIYT